MERLEINCMKILLTFYLLLICLSHNSCATKNIKKDHYKSDSEILGDTTLNNSLSYLTTLQVEGSEIYFYVDSSYFYVFQRNYNIPFSTTDNEYSLKKYKNYNGYFADSPDSILYFDKVKFKKNIKLFRRDSISGFSICDTCVQSLRGDSIYFTNEVGRQFMSALPINSNESILSSIKSNGDVEISEFIKTETGIIENILINYGQEHSYIWFDLYLINIKPYGIKYLIISKTLPMRDNVYDLDFYNLN